MATYLIDFVLLPHPDPGLTAQIFVYVARCNSMYWFSWFSLFSRCTFSASPNFNPFDAETLMLFLVLFVIDHHIAEASFNKCIRSTTNALYYAVDANYC